MARLKNLTALPVLESKGLRAIAPTDLGVNTELDPGAGGSFYLSKLAESDSEIDGGDRQSPQQFLQGE